MLRPLRDRGSAERLEVSSNGDADASRDCGADCVMCRPAFWEAIAPRRTTRTRLRFPALSVCTRRRCSRCAREASLGVAKLARAELGRAGSGRGSGDDGASCSVSVAGAGRLVAAVVGFGLGRASHDAAAGAVGWGGLLGDVERCASAATGAAVGAPLRSVLASSAEHDDASSVAVLRVGCEAAVALSLVGTGWSAAGAVTLVSSAARGECRPVAVSVALSTVAAGARALVSTAAAGSTALAAAAPVTCGWLSVDGTVPAPPSAFGAGDCSTRSAAASTVAAAADTAATGPGAGVFSCSCAAISASQVAGKPAAFSNAATSRAGTPASSARSVWGCEAGRGGKSVKTRTEEKRLPSSPPDSCSLARQLTCSPESGP